MSPPVAIALSALLAVAAGALGTYCLGSLLVMGGRTGSWLESHGWVFPAGIAAGGAVLAAGLAVALWPVATLGAAVALAAAGRYVWLNV